MNSIKDYKNEIFEVKRFDSENKFWVIDEGKLTHQKSFIWAIDDADKSHLFIVIDSFTHKQRIFKGIEVPHIIRHK